MDSSRRVRNVRRFAGFTVAVCLLLAVALVVSARLCTADKQGENAGSRASSDNRSKVEFKEMTISVGPGGQLPGTDDLALQAGVDYLQKFGGGVLRVMPGEYVMRNSLRLSSHVKVIGGGVDTVLKKAPGVKTLLTRDSDWYECQVEVADAAGFTPGCGVLLRAQRDEEKGLAGLKLLKATVTAVEGATLFIDRRLDKDFWLGEHASAATVFSIITAQDAENVHIENLVLDGNRQGNEEIDGNICGGVFLLRCKDFSFKNVTVRNYNGDGFSLQICDDLSCEGCAAEVNARYGFHLGSGSQRTALRNCTSRSNLRGVFFCWGVNDAVVDNTACIENGEYGILLGHRDADNTISNCTIERNAKVGIIFTKQDAVFDGAHRNVITGCHIRDNGPDAPGAGVCVEEPNEDIAIRNNVFEDTGAGRQAVAIHVSPNIAKIAIEGNQFVKQAVEVDRSVTMKQRIKKLVGR